MNIIERSALWCCTIYVGLKLAQEAVWIPLTIAVIWGVTLYFKLKKHVDPPANDFDDAGATS